MLKNYFVVALRNMRRHLGYSAINLGGLAVGLTCSFFVLLWVQDELSYDRFLPGSDRVYQVTRNVHMGGETETWTGTAKPLADILRSDYAELDAVVQTTGTQLVVTQGEDNYREAGLFASATYFEVFPLPFVQGDPATALAGLDAAVITDRTARKLFGENWLANDAALGRTITIDHRKDFTIRGVIEDLPHNSSFQFDVLIPIQDLYGRFSSVEFWGNNFFSTYVRLRETADPAEVDSKISGIVNANEEGADEDLFLRAYEDMYLYSDYVDGQLVGGRIDTVRLFGLVAIFILLIAAINFMNLATARSSQRVREIGVRKSIGAHRGALIRQFLGESLLLAFVAFVLAVGLVVMLMPLFRSLTGKTIALSSLGGSYLVAGLSIAVFVGLLAGSYPAVYLSSFNPLAALRGSLHSRPGASALRKGLIVFQFGVSTLLIVATLAVYSQMQFIQNRDIGLNRNNVIYHVQEGALLQQYEAVRQELMSRPGIEGVTASSSSPLQVGRSTSSASWQGKSPDNQFETYVVEANFEFLQTMGMELAAGRTFSREFSTDSAGVVVNETMAERMGGGNVVGRQLSFWDQSGPILGVVRDFDMNSAYAPDQPVVIALSPTGTSRLYVRAVPGSMAEAISSLGDVIEDFAPGIPFEPQFLSEEFAAEYRSEVVLGRLSNAFAVIAVFLSCLGLFGLTSYASEQRTKEIGVRKVLGASVARIVFLLTSDQLKLVVLGIVIGLPVAYLGVNEWLTSFDTHFDAGPQLFVAAGAIAVIIAALTVCLQASRTAVVNPVDSLRSE